MELNHQLVLVEGRIYPNARVIQHGAVQVTDDVVPVTWDFGSDPIGVATNWRRDEATGECWMDLDIAKPPLSIEELMAMDVNVYLTETVKESENVIISGVLKAVSFTQPVEGGWHYDVKEVENGATTTST